MTKKYRWVAADDLLWFSQLLTTGDKQKQLALVDARMSSDPHGMEAVFANMVVGSGWSQAERAAASYFWLRGYEKGLWPDDPEIRKGTSGYLKILEEKLNEDDSKENLE